MYEKNTSLKLSHDS